MARSRKKPAQAQGQAELLSRKEAAAYLGVGVQTLAIWKSAKRYDLPVIKVGRLARYRKEDLDRFLENRTIDTTADESANRQRAQIPFLSMKDRQAQRQKSVEFAEVQLVDHKPKEATANGPRCAPLEVVLPSGISFRVAEDCSLELLGSVISYLENR